MANLVTRQTRVPEQWIEQFKRFASNKSAQQGEKYMLQTMYEDAIVLFLKHRVKLQEKSKTVFYMGSPKDGKELNIKMREELANRVARIAKADGTKVRRFLFTALCHFSETYNIT